MVASDIGQGDSEIVFLDVAPADGSTQVTLTVEPPSSASYDVTMTGGPFEPITGSTDSSQRWTSTQPVTFNEPGRWVLHYEVTGTGEGAEDLEVYVVASPAAGGPTWLPGRSRVAAYVPHRTLSRTITATVASEDVYEMTFDSTTVPTGIVVDRLIADGADWITAIVAPLNVKSQPLAALCSALWAAISVERSWPNDDQSLPRANDMEKQLNAMVEALKASNAAENTNDGTPSIPPPVQPVWSFPYADQRWDYPGYW